MDYGKLAKELENASPLEIMDNALAKFGNDIAIAFRYIYIYLLALPFFNYLLFVCFSISLLTY